MSDQLWRIVERSLGSGAGTAIGVEDGMLVIVLQLVQDLIGNGSNKPDERQRERKWIVIHMIVSRVAEAEAKAGSRRDNKFTAFRHCTGCV